MFRSSTLVVVGAGASQEAGLPTAPALARSISEKVNIRFRHLHEQVSGDDIICSALRHYMRRVDPKNPDINPYLHEGWQMAGALPHAISIDTYLDNHAGNERIELLGKLGIVRSVLDAERNSKLYVQEERTRNIIPNFNALADTWYAKLTHVLTEGCHRRDVQNMFADISFIIFNYDRCVEHFLFHSLQNHYGIPSAEAREVMTTLGVLHPYGVVGRLPWQTNERPVGFGDELYDDELLAAANQIKTFSERIDDEDALQSMRAIVRAAKHVVYLGFAFHAPNMELLCPAGETAAERIFATTYGISDSDLQIIEGELRAQFEDVQGRFRFDHKSVKCSQFFDEYRRTLLS